MPGGAPWADLGYPSQAAWLSAGSPNTYYQPGSTAPPAGGGGGGGGGGRNKLFKIQQPNGNLEDAWIPGANEATSVYNSIAKQGYDPNGYLDTTLSSLMSLQDPTANPYLDQMFNMGAENIREEMFSSLGSSGRGRPQFDPATGVGNDVFANYVDQLSNFGSQLYGNAYDQDMNRSLSATVAAPAAVTQSLDAQNWGNLQNYSDIVSQLTGTSQQEPPEPGDGNPLLQLAGAGLGTWAALGSSRDYKDKIDTETGVLPKLAALDVDRWKYHPDKGDGGEHIGPYAEDFHKAFNIGDSKSINVIDALGVQFAGLKELAAEVEALRKGMGVA